MYINQFFLLLFLSVILVHVFPFAFSISLFFILSFFLQKHFIFSEFLRFSFFVRMNNRLMCLSIAVYKLHVDFFLSSANLIRGFSSSMSVCFNSHSNSPFVRILISIVVFCIKYPSIASIFSYYEKLKVIQR